MALWISFVVMVLNARFHHHEALFRFDGGTKICWLFCWVLRGGSLHIHHQHSRHTFSTSKGDTWPSKCLRFKVVKLNITQWVEIWWRCWSCNLMQSLGCQVQFDRIQNSQWNMAENLWWWCLESDSANGQPLKLLGITYVYIYIFFSRKREIELMIFWLSWPSGNKVDWKSMGDFRWSFACKEKSRGFKQLGWESAVLAATEVMGFGGFFSHTDPLTRWS